jgi:hypothetical protein
VDRQHCIIVKPASFNHSLSLIQGYMCLSSSPPSLPLLTSVSMSPLLTRFSRGSALYLNVRGSSSRESYSCIREIQERNFNGRDTPKRERERVRVSERRTQRDKVMMTLCLFFDTVSLALCRQFHSQPHKKTA